MPLWTDLDRLGERVGVLDAYTLVVGAAALALLSLHGGLWLRDRVRGELCGRLRRVCSGLFVATALALAAVTAWSFAVQQNLATRMGEASWGAIFPLVAAVAWAWSFWQHRRGQTRRAFLGSCAMIYALVASAAFGTYPYVLIGASPGTGLTLQDAAAPAYGLEVALWWWVPGMGLILAYHWFVYSRLPRTIVIGDPSGA